MANQKEKHFTPPTTALDWAGVAVATAGGAGFVPIAPGTAGTVVAVPLYWLLSARLQWPAWAFLSFLVALSALGMAAAQRVGKPVFHASDAGQIVIDEVVGYLLTVALIPFSWKAAILGFVIFRVLDMTKPWPASYFDRKVHNGFGVTMDDLCAGAWGRLLLGVILHFWP
jgi:phosphatidylglycerophosphatase A